MGPLPPPPVVTQELHIVDGQGRLRILLSAKSGTPVIEILKKNGKSSAVITLDSTDHPSIKLSNPDASGSTAAIEVDDKGAHVKFDRPGGASAYLFLNNAGGSGVVLLDTSGVRRLDALVAPDGTPKIERFDPDGKARP